MDTPTPLEPSVLPPAPDSPPAGTVSGGPKMPAASTTPARAFRAWWLLKKWAWRNTAAVLWLAFVYSSFRGLGAAFGADLPPILAMLPSETSGRTLTLALVAWLLFICELQLTQCVTFAVYTVSLPFWLPFLAGFHYFRNRFGSLSVKASPLKHRALRLAAAVLLSAIYLWWPLPNRQIAFILGIVAFGPGLLLLRYTFGFCVAPGVWMRSLRSTAHGFYEAVKASDATSASNTDPATAAQVEGWKRYVVDKYETSFIPEIERGLLRKVVVLYFCGLVSSCLLYFGFVAALFLRALTASPEALAAALGRASLPNLLHMAAICSLGVLGTVRINASLLPSSAAWLVTLLSLAPIGAGVVFTATFFGGYSADIAKVEEPTSAGARPGT